MVYEDLRDLENVREVALVELLEDALPARVGSPLSIRSLSEDLQVAHETVARWLAILENLYVCFRIPPFGAPRIRAVKKENKLYLWTGHRRRPPAKRFENLVACHLLKYCHHLEDTEGYRMELRFVRDTDRREVDFVVIRDGGPLFAVECKSGEKSPNPRSATFGRERRSPTSSRFISASGTTFRTVRGCCPSGRFAGSSISRESPFNVLRSTAQVGSNDKVHSILLPFPRIRQ